MKLLTQLIVFFVYTIPYVQIADVSFCMNAAIVDRFFYRTTGFI